MLTPNELRKKLGCWSCNFCTLDEVVVDAKAACSHPDPSIRENFQGYDTAITCRGYRMKPCNVKIEEKENDK